MTSTESGIFDRLCQVQSLRAGFERVFDNRGGPGGDGDSVFDLRENLELELAELSAELLSGLYRPGPHRYVDIPKKSGGTRRLSIPCVRDRVVQSALHILLAPNLERAFEATSFAYRPGRGVRQAVAAVERFRDAGYRYVVDADIKSFFDRVPHDALLAVFQRYEKDARIVRLIRLWLAVADADGDGLGLPQGGPISPMLANLFLDDLDEAFNRSGMRAVRFADDFLILCKTQARAEDALEDVCVFLRERGLALHPEKTRIVSFDDGFRFLGHLFVKSLSMKAETEERPRVAAPKGAVPLTQPNIEPAAGSLNSAQAPGGSDDGEGADLPLLLRGDDPQGDLVPVEILHATRRSRHAPHVRPLYVYSPGHVLSVRNQAWSVRLDGGEVFAAATNWVDRVEVGPNVVVEDAAIDLALDSETPLVFATASGRPRGEVMPVIARRGKRHLAQANAVLDPHSSVALASAMVEAKLTNQKAQLYRLNRRRANETVRNAAFRIGRIALKTRIAETIDVLRGIEGEAAAIYWPALGKCLEHGFTLNLRGRREKKNPVSLILDFTSALLTRDVDVLVRRAGLHPAFGILHASRNAASPASYDFIEPFRAPLAEALTVYLFNNRILAKRDFETVDDDRVAIFPTGRDKVIRTYESWLARLVRNPRSGGDQFWRGVIADDIAAFVRHIEEGEPFKPYRMKH